MIRVWRNVKRLSFVGCERIHDLDLILDNKAIVHVFR